MSLSGQACETADGVGTLSRHSSFNDQVGARTQSACSSSPSRLVKGVWGLTTHGLRPPCAPGPPFTPPFLARPEHRICAPVPLRGDGPSPREVCRSSPHWGTQDRPPSGLLWTTCKADTLLICTFHITASGSGGLVSHICDCIEL